VLYELCTGTLPFDAPNQLELFTRIVQAAPEPPSRRRPDLPAGLDAAIMGCLEKDRYRRHASVAAFAAALLPFAPPEAQALPARIARVLGAPEGATPLPQAAPELAPLRPSFATMDAPPARPPLPSAPAPHTLTDLRPQAAPSPAITPGPALASAPIMHTTTATGSTFVPVAPVIAPPNRSAVPVIAAGALALVGIVIAGVKLWPSAAVTMGPQAAPNPAPLAAAPIASATEIPAAASNAPTTAPAADDTPPPAPTTMEPRATADPAPAKSAPAARAGTPIRKTTPRRPSAALPTKRDDF
jgi:serine/threonine-protein kinase